MKSELFLDPVLAGANLSYMLRTPDLVNVTTLGAQFHPVASESLMKKLTSECFAHSLSSALQQSKSHFLGAYAETLWKCYLMEHHHYELIENGLQIHETGKTLGEFDFILKDKKNSEFIHQELAIKFYLGLPVAKAAPGSMWFGPNNIDRLDKKCAHLKTRQLTFGTQPSAQRQLRELGIETLRTECIVRGRLFLPADDKLRRQMQIDDDFTRNAASNYWYTLDQFIQHSVQEKYCRYRVLQKPQWISAFTEPELDFFGREEFLETLTRHVSEENRTVMVKTLNELTGEASIEFVVPERWIERSYNSIGMLDA